MNTKRTLTLLITLIVSISFIGCDSKSQNTEEFSTSLICGNYIVGRDIPPGKYDIAKQKGNGYLTIKDGEQPLLHGLISDIERLDRIEPSHSDVELKKDVTIKISGGLVLDFKSRATNVDEYSPLVEDMDNQILLWPNYIHTSGVEFPEGIYNIEVFEGSDPGVVQSSNLLTDGITETMGDYEDDKLQDLFPSQFRNVNLPKGTTLMLTDVQIILIPLK